MIFGLDEDVEFKKYFLPNFLIRKKWQKMEKLTFVNYVSMLG
jgi:hypothetical protein